MYRKKGYFIVIIISFLLCSCIGKGSKSSQEGILQEQQYRKSVMEYDLSVNGVNSSMFAASNAVLF